MGALARIATWGACAASIGYGVPQLLQVAGLLPDPVDRILIFAPSLALAPLFAVALAALAGEATGEGRAWRFGAFALALLYAGHVSQVYVGQLGVVIPRELAGMAPVTGFGCCGFRQPMTAVDLLGYTEMSLATLLLAPSFRGAARAWLAINGLTAVPVFLQLWWPALIWAGAAWLVTFPVAMALVARALDRARA
ncbi:hypothetical protein [Sphingomonas hengshuiensis]|uniref:hypothetical protein n=1 Tax=Sphingomonas hengshuiensis TaxID=1609977 RepID=UPI0005C9B823|nr:hypothetical protein [Sphingomonas hengshuiensis]